MKLVTYEAGGRSRAGVLTDDGVLDAGSATMGELLAAGAPPQPGGDPIQPERLLPPVTDPGKIVCIGLNYLSHAREQGAEPPETPTFFASTAMRWRPRAARSGCLTTARRSTTRRRSRSWSGGAPRTSPRSRRSTTSRVTRC